MLEVDLHVNSMLIKAVFIYFRHYIAILLNPIQEWGEAEQKVPLPAFFM